jgi:hypothetical protein
VLQNQTYNHVTENEKFIYDSIVSEVKMGFTPTDEIKDIVMEQVDDNGFEKEISEEWVLTLVDEEFAKRVKESKSWKSPTDTERLIKAFEELCAMNIIALHNAGYTTSDGEGEVVEVEKELRKKKVVSDGYCFYHGQDLERAISPDQPNLMIAFQKIDNSNDEVTVAVGKKVADVLKRNGFKVKWNETATKKIEIAEFVWQKVYREGDEDLLNYDSVIESMSKK